MSWHGGRIAPYARSPDFGLSRLPDAAQHAPWSTTWSWPHEFENGLLPATDVAIAGWEIAYHYRPAGLVGGDYCDVIPDERGGLYFMIADVAGKGVAAAMLTANLRAVMRALVPLGLPLQKMLAQTNRLFCESKLPMQYATLIVGHSSAMGDLELVNAGHLPAMIIRGKEVELFESNDLPLGMFCDQQFTPVRTQLGPKETLVLFTDGVCEAENPAGENMGPMHCERCFCRMASGAQNGWWKPAAITWSSSARAACVPMMKRCWRFSSRVQERTRQWSNGPRNLAGSLLWLSSLPADCLRLAHAPDVN